MKSRYVSLRKNPAGSPEIKKISYPGKGTRFGKHLFITCLKIEYTLCYQCYKNISIKINLLSARFVFVNIGCKKKQKQHLVTLNTCTCSNIRVVILGYP